MGDDQFELNLLTDQEVEFDPLPASQTTDDGVTRFRPLL